MARDTYASSVVRLIRKDFFEHPQGDWKSMTKECQSASVPSSSKNLVNMILRRSEFTKDFQEYIKPDDECDQAVLIISQLIHFHVSTRKPISHSIRRVKKRETPASVYLAMKLYGATRVIVSDFSLKFSTQISNSSLEEWCRILRFIL